MNKQLRILILEDNPADAELVQFELTEGGIDFTAKVVMTEKDFVRELTDFCSDLILSDYDLPQYNGALALAEARRRCPDTPFILVTGAIVEDRAIEILTKGAKDYVLKAKLQQRLVPAINRALAEAEEHRARKRAEAELREARRNLEEKVKARTAELEAEIAERKKMTERLGMAQRAAKVGIWDWDIVTGHIEWSPQMFDLFGINPLIHTASFEAWKSVLHPEDREIAGLNIDRALRRQTILNSDYRIVLPEGQMRWINSIGEGRYDDDGRPIRMTGICMDITSRKQAESQRETALEELKKSEERYRDLVRQAPAGIYAVDFATGRFTEVNDAMCQILSYTRDELLSLTAFDVMDEEGRALFAQRIRRAQSGELLGESIEYRIKTKDGRIIWALLNITFHRIGGRIAGATVIAHDITERKQAEQELQQMTERLEMAQRAAKIGIWDWDIVSGHLEWSPQMFDLFGLDLLRNTASFAMWKSVLHPEDREIAGRRIDEALKQKTTLNSEYRVVLPDKQIRWLNCIGEGKYDEQGRPVRMIGICMDITERKAGEKPSV